MLSSSAHIDTFTRDNLPPLGAWPEFRFELPDVRYPTVLNCVSSLLDRHVVKGVANHRCLVTDSETWTYGDLLARSNQVANVLVHQLGLVPGNRVLLRGPNNPWLVAAWFGVMKRVG